ncbi:MAG: hypothetical protein JNJ46_28435 [Myxococcales bacterium]|nr:hypothetical protein [Myxococcales bacterium]
MLAKPGQHDRIGVGLPGRHEIRGQCIIPAQLGALESTAWRAQLVVLRRKSECEQILDLCGASEV